MAINQISEPPFKLNSKVFSDKNDFSDEDNDLFIKDIKLTDWENEPSIQDLKEDFEGAKQTHEEIKAKIQKYTDLRNITGNVKIKKIKGRSAIQPKLIRKQAEWRYSALSEPFLSSDKIFKVEPRTWEDTKSAIDNELILNYQFDIKINKVKFIDDYIRTCVNDGTAIIQVGWDRKTHIEKVEVPILEYFAIDTLNPINEEEINKLTQAVRLKTENPNEFLNLPIELQESCNYYLDNNIPVTAKIIGTQEIDKEIVDENKPIIKIIDPQNFYIDPSCEGDINNAKFIINSFQTCKADLQATGLYKNLDLINLSANTLIDDTEFKTNTPKDYQFKDKPRKLLVAYEYWGYYDIHNNGELVCIVATWVNDILIRLEESPFPDGKPPFVIVNYMPIAKNVFGEADAELLEDNQKTLGALYRGNIDLLGRSANAQQGIAKGFLDVINQSRFNRGEDYEYNPNISPDIGIYQHKYPEINQTSMVMLELQNQEAESLTGVKSFSGGMSGNAYGDVAAGIRGMLDAASKREMNILRRLAQGIKEIGLKVIAMNSIFLSDEEVIRITNEEFKRINREDLKGQYDLKVDISTPEIDQVKAQELAFMLQTLGNTMDFNVTKILLTEIARLRKMPELAHAIKAYEPQPDPLTEQLKQLQIEKVQLELEELKSKIELNTAKARETASNADSKDLDFVEKQTGVAHKRELEKQKAQAEANQDLAVTKGIIDSGKNQFKNDPLLNTITTENALQTAMGYNELTKEKNSSNNNIDPTINIRSKNFDPKKDSALNPNLNFE